MQQPTIYLTTNEITNLNNVYGQARLSYATPASPSTLDPRSIKLYEAQIYPSLGYTKGKQLTLGVDYEITKGDIDDMGRNVKDVWLVKLKGDYLTTNGQFVVEYNTHYDHLNPNASSGDSGAAVKTEVTNNGVLAYQNVNNQLGGGLFGATVNLIDSGVTLKDPETPTPEVKKGNVDVTYVAEDGTVLEATTDVVKDGEVGTDYTTEKKKFDGYSFS
ncbi:MucBP domain-containing protein, partial [Ligilactobacillus salivarius]